MQSIYFVLSFSTKQTAVHFTLSKMVLSLSKIAVHHFSFRQVLVGLLVTTSMLTTSCCLGKDSKCEFKAIFNFGDSNSDTGGFWAAFPAQSGPFGMTYFNKPTGRATDGRLILDFLGKVTLLQNLLIYCKKNKKNKISVSRILGFFNNFF